MNEQQVEERFDRLENALTIVLVLTIAPIIGVGVAWAIDYIVGGKRADGEASK